MCSPALRRCAPVVLALVAAACSPAAQGRGDALPAEPGAVVGYQDLVDALRVRGHDVDERGSVSQPFLEPEGRRLEVSGEAVQVFEYPSEDAARAASSEISPDGSEVGETRVRWDETPHWYQRGRLLVLHLGDAPRLSATLGDVMGHQVAGG